MKNVTWTKIDIKIVWAVYSTLEIQYNANKEIEKYYVSSKCTNPVLKQCIT